MLKPSEKVKREASGACAEFADRQGIAAFAGRRQPREVAAKCEHDLGIGVGNGGIAGDVMRHLALAPGLDAAPGEIGVLQLPNAQAEERPAGLDDKSPTAVRPRRNGTFGARGGISRSLWHIQVHRSAAILALGGRHPRSGPVRSHYNKICRKQNLRLQGPPRIASNRCRLYGPQPAKASMPSFVTVYVFCEALAIPGKPKFRPTV